jgi:hypothetical protein
LTVLGILAAVGFSMLLICGGLFAYFVHRGMQHSGWQQVTFHGYTIKMPSEKLKQRTVPQPGVTVHEAVYRRRESGSQYLLLVSQPSVAELRSLDVNELVRRSSVTLAGQRQVQRAGIAGIRGTVIAGPFGAKGSEAEFFMHNGNMIIAIYAPYSAIRDNVGGGRPSRDNERELDRPEEFFESLTFP